MIWFLLAIITLLVVGLGICIYFLWRFANIIILFEDDISDAIDSLLNVEESMNKVLAMELFFDSPEVRHAVQEVIDDVKFSRMSIMKVAERFVARSKQKYVVEENPEVDEQLLMRLSKGKL